MDAIRIVYVVFLTFTYFLICNPADAWLRGIQEDSIVVERSELIVVGHIEEGSIQYIPHNKKSNEGASWEHHATLIIVEVLKGKCDEKKIPFVIHYGLDPEINGCFLREIFKKGNSENIKDSLKGAIEVFDIAGEERMPLVKDARENNLWFLRKLTGFRGEKSGGDIFGITDPEDLQPLEKKDYFLSYLSDNTEARIDRYARKMRQDLGGAQRYLDHMQVQRIMQIQDINKRLEKLLPFYIAEQRWNGKNEARVAIIACGVEAGTFLIKIYNNPKYIEKKGDIALILGGAFKLMETLKANNEFWRNKKIVKENYIQGNNPEETLERQRVYTQTYRTLHVLNIILSNEYAVPVVEETKRLWSREGFKSNQIIEECDRFLKKHEKKDVD